MFSGLISFQANSGEALALNDVFTLDTSGNMIKAQADDIENIGRGIITYAVASGELAEGVEVGLWNEFVGLTPGSVYYLSQTVAGAMTTIRPTSGIIQRIGKAKSATQMPLSLSTETLDAAGSSGGSFQVILDETDRVTTSSTLVDIPSALLTTDADASADYKIEFDCEVDFSQSTGVASFQIMVDGVLQSNTLRNFRAVASNSSNVLSFHLPKNIAISKQVKIQFAVSAGTLTIKKYTFSLTRIN